MDNQEPATYHDAVPIPQPIDPGNKQYQTDTAAQSAPLPSKSIPPVEIVTLTILGLVGLCGISGTVLSFVPASEPSQSNIALAPMCLGLTVAGFSSAGLVWFRRRDANASAWLVTAIVLWFVGVAILGFGGFAVLNPGDITFAENLAFSLGLCFAPGGFLALAGLGLYAYDRRRSRPMQNQKQAAETVKPQAAARDKPQQSQADKLERAAEYRAHILEIIDQQGAAFADQLTPIKTELWEWEAHLHELAERLHNFEANEVIQRDLREVPAAIERLQTQLEIETNPRLRTEIGETLAGYQKHQQQLESLTTLMRRTELDIDETLAAIAGIYSQLQLLSAKGIDRSRAKRLSAEIEEQADHLNDLLSAMDEVYDSSS